MNTQNNTYSLKAINFRLSLLAVATLVSSSAIGATPQQEIQQLRDEVNQLKLLVEQYRLGATQTGTPEISNSTNTSMSKRTVSIHSNQGETTKDLNLSKGGASVTLYGNVRADASYQAEGGAQSRLYNQISSVPLRGQNEASDEFKSTLAATRLGLDFKAPSVLGSRKDVTAKVEVDFLGANDTLRIRHAYLNYGPWLMGQTWSNFAIPDYMPESIDALGYVGGAVKRTPQLRYTYPFQPNAQLSLALEDPKDALNLQRLPALTAHWKQKVNRDLTVSARGMLNEKRSSTDEATSWGIGLGAKYDLNEHTSLKADYYHVKGDSSFVSWTNPGVVLSATQEIVAQNQFDSITAGITHQFNPQWRGTLGYGYMKFDQDQLYIQAVADPTQVNKSLWQAWGNVFYSPIQPLSFGVEYVYGEREAFAAAQNGQDTGEDNRLNAVAIYNF